MALRSFSFFFFLVLLLAIVSTSHSLPFVFIHGLVDNCTTDKSIRIVSHLKTAAGVEGKCIEIGADPEADAIKKTMKEQIDIACEKVKKLEYLKDGFNIFAVSQGTLIARGLIEFCDGAPPVNNFVSLAGPHAGVGKIPPCDEPVQICHLLNAARLLIAIDPNIVYTLLQYLAAPFSYYKESTNIEEYLKHSIFLPKLNNERPDKRNETYWDRFSSLNTLVLLRNEKDTVLIPNETAWFGFYKDGTEDVLTMEETELYKEDWIGLRRLNETGRLKKDIVPGGHAHSSNDDLDKYVVPYLKDEQPPSTLNLNNHARRSTSKLLYRYV